MSEQTPTLSAINETLDATYTGLQGLLARLREPLSETPDAGGWTVRQAMSHIVGALVRTPVHAGFVLGGDGTIPLQINDPYWLPEWGTAPLLSFQLALDAGYHANKAFLATLLPVDLGRTAQTPFGEMPLAGFLTLSYGFHMTKFHFPQLEAFVAGQEDEEGRG